MKKLEKKTEEKTGTGEAEAGSTEQTPDNNPTETTESTDTPNQPKARKPKRKNKKKKVSTQQQNASSKFSTDAMELHKNEIRAILLIETARKPKTWDYLTKAVEYEYFDTKVSDLIGCSLYEYLSTAKQDNYFVVTEDKLTLNSTLLRQAIFKTIETFLQKNNPISLSNLASYLADTWDTEIWYTVFNDKLKLFMSQFPRLKIEGDKVTLVDLPVQEKQVHPETDRVKTEITQFLRTSGSSTLNVLDGHLKDTLHHYCYQIINVQLKEFLSSHRGFVLENNTVKLIDVPSLVTTVEKYVDQKGPIPINYADIFVKRHWQLSVEDISGLSIDQLITTKIPTLQIDDKDFVSSRSKTAEWSSPDV